MVQKQIVLSRLHCFTFETTSILKTSFMVNLRSNYPNLSEEGELFKNFFANYPVDHFRLRSISPFLLAHEQGMLSSFLNTDDPLLQNNSQTIACNSGTSAIFIVLSCLQNKDNRIAVEDFTYSGLLNAARQLQFETIPMTCDEEGPLPEAVEKAILDGITIFYLQPTIHNPTNRVMGEERRREIASLLKGTNAILMEDDAYRFLHPAPPPRFLRLLPEQTISIVSLSKPFHSFLQTCFLHYPEGSLPGLEAMLNLSGTETPYLMRCFSFYLLQKGYIEEIVKNKREVAVERKKGVGEILSPFSYRTFPTSFHLWIQLPPSANSVAITKALKKENILVNGGHEYSPTANTSHLRIALSSEEDSAKRNGAVEKLKELLLSTD